MAGTFDSALKRQIARRDKALNSLRDSVTDTGEGIKQQISQTSDNIKAKILGTADSIKDKITGTSDHIKDQISETGESIQTKISEFGEKISLKHAVSEHPYVTLGTAVGAGLLASRFLLPNRNPQTVSQPHRVMVEVVHSSDGKTEVRPIEAAPAPRKGPLDYLTKALSAFQSARTIMDQITAIKQSQKSEPVETVPDSAQVDPEPMPTI